jgi:hypothetical protein
LPVVVVHKVRALAFSPASLTAVLSSVVELLDVITLEGPDDARRRTCLEVDSRDGNHNGKQANNMKNLTNLTNQWLHCIARIYDLVGKTKYLHKNSVFQAIFSLKLSIILLQIDIFVVCGVSL